MKMRNITTGILVLMMLSMTLMPLVPVMAYPSDDVDRFFVIAGIKLRHLEVRDLDSSEWIIDLGEIQGSRWYWYRDVSVTDSSDQYDLDWTGRLYYSIFTKEWSFEYTDYFDFNLTAKGDGTTSPGPGMHYIKPGDDYTFTAKPYSTGNKDWEYVLDYWNVSDGTTEWQVKGTTLTGVAESDLDITAVFRRRSTHTCNVWYEDGLTAWTLWQNRHVPLAVWLPFGLKSVTIIVEGDNIAYNRTFLVTAKDMCVYFLAERFVGDYTVTAYYIDSTDTLYFLEKGDFFVGIT